MKIEAILLHSNRFAELADFYRRALDLPEPTPLGATRLTPPNADESPREIIARVRDPAGNVLGLLADA